MLLERVSIVRLGPFGEAEFDFVNADLQPRSMTVLWGEGGVGRTTVLSAMMSTRPGFLTQPRGLFRQRGGVAFAKCRWRLNAEEMDKPCVVELTTPNAVPASAESEANSRQIRAELERRAATGRGCTFIYIPGNRFFARAPVNLVDPARTMMHFDVRTAGIPGEPGRIDIGRLCKQSLIYSNLVMALAGDRKGDQNDPRFLGVAMKTIVNEVVGLAGYQYVGTDALSLEPVFLTEGGQRITYDGLPNQIRHLISFVCIPVRALWASSGGCDPRDVEGVVAIDDVELHLSERVMENLLNVLQIALPRVQWVLSTSSATLAACTEPDSLVSLRRLSDSDDVELYTGDLARCH